MRTVDPPEPTEGMALIRVEASTVAFADTLTRRGLYPPGLKEPGMISGGEAVGRVLSVGLRGDHELVGHRVFAYTGLGGHAELVNAPVDGVIPIPDEMDPKVVAGFGVISLVAQVALERAGVGPDTVVLVRGAAGSLGSATVRLASLAGATVHATASSPDRARYVEKLGAALVLDREGHSPRGDRPTCHVVIDPVGGPTVPEFISMLAPNGRYVLLGAAAGLPSVEFGSALLANFFKSLTFSTFSFHAIPTPERAGAFSKILAAHGSGRLSADIDRVVSLDEIQDAHRRIEAGANLGKIVLAF